MLPCCFIGAFYKDRRFPRRLSKGRRFIRDHSVGRHFLRGHGNRKSRAVSKIFEFLVVLSTIEFIKGNWTTDRSNILRRGEEGVEGWTIYIYIYL